VYGQSHRFGRAASSVASAPPRAPRRIRRRYAAAQFITANQRDWQSIQLTAIVDDVDEAGKKPARVAWRGSNQLIERNSNFGHFAR
jgi:hypothetical protein